jgi:hypothetical protein
MIRKMAFTIFAFALGSFGVNRVGGVPAKVVDDGAVAWAQNSDDSGGDVIQPESKKSPPPDIAGSYCGSVNDMDLGMGTINLAVNQKGAKLSGSWSDSLGGSGKFNGKIKGDAITATFREPGTKCKLAVVGTLVAPDEVTGSYSVFGCHQSDGGTFDITSSGC